jgi:hypothetical protein
VAKGAPLAHLHVRDPADAQGAIARVAAAFTLGARAPRAKPLVIETIRR